MSEEVNKIFEQWKQFLSWCYENNDKTTEIHRDNLEKVMEYTKKLENQLQQEENIIKEDKKIEEIKIDFDELYKHYIVTTTINEKKYNSITNSATDKIFCSKINEIIKYINKNEEKK